MSQLDIFGNMTEPTPKPTNREKRNWENAFQKWSNKEFQEGRYGYGACGYGSMCDYCKDMGYGRPCVRALNEMLREANIKLDYKNITFEELENYFIEKNDKKFKATQVFDWVYKKRISSFDEMRNVSKDTINTMTNDFYFEKNKISYGISIFPNFCNANSTSSPK